MSKDVLILDGGMGTTLEDEFAADISSTLWSSSLLSTAQGCDVLQALHGRFVEAGADLIQTSTRLRSTSSHKMASRAM